MNEENFYVNGKVCPRPAMIFSYTTWEENHMLLSKYIGHYVEIQFVDENGSTTIYSGIVKYYNLGKVGCGIITFTIEPNRKIEFLFDAIDTITVFDEVYTVSKILLDEA